MMKMTLAFALALAAALPLSADAQGRGKGNGNGKGYDYSKCRANGGNSNSRMCRDRYGENQRRNGRWDDRDSDSDSDGRWGDARTSDRRRTSNGGICIDRNRDGYCDNGTTSGRTDCTDRDRDGLCDSRDSCVDIDRNGRCDRRSSDGGWGTIGDVVRGGRYDGAYSTNRRYPGSLPLMQYAPRFANGERVSAVRQWLGSDDVRVRYQDRNRDGRVESATWLSPAGTVLQVWQDVNYDGRADRVRVYDRGRLVRTIQ